MLIIQVFHFYAYDLVSRYFAGLLLLWFLSLILNIIDLQSTKSLQKQDIARLQTLIWIGLFIGITIGAGERTARVIKAGGNADAQSAAVLIGALFGAALGALIAAFIGLLIVNLKAHFKKATISDRDKDRAVTQ